jgi:4-hydroxy-tetrahydrodipicolinate reductase
MPIAVVMSGVSGRTGREVALALERAEGIELRAGIGERSAGTALGPLLGLPDDGRKVYASLAEANRAVGGADVWVDFSHALAAEAMLPEALRLGLKAVVGTSGLSPDFVARLAPEVARFGGAVAIVPNFSLGATLQAELARIAWREYGAAEIVELHSAHKRDKPSATALALAESLGGVPIHSVRLPGLVAHQEVLFGGEGEVLTIRHDVLARSAYGPGVVRSVRAIVERQGLFTSLAALLREA